MKLKLQTKYLAFTVILSIFVCWLLPSLCIFLYLGRNVGLANEQMVTLASRLADKSRGKDGVPNLDLIKQARAGLWILQSEFFIADAEGHVLKSLSEGRPLEAAPVDFINSPESAHVVSRLSSLRYLVLVSRLPGNPAYYLYVRQTRPSFTGRLLFTTVGLVASAFCAGTMIGLFFLFRFFRTRAREVIRVLGHLREGRLEERFKVSKLDEVGELMVRFNEMADELVRVVRQLRQSESMRKKLVREISHDLRTPLTGARMASENLANLYDQLSPEDRKTCAVITEAEIRYLQQIVEDLFYMAEIEEPQYRADLEPISLTQLFKEEWRGFQASLETHYGKKLELSPLAEEELFVLGVRTGLVRLLRNAIENAMKYATNKVTVEMTSDERSVSLRVRDDGPGATPEKIQKFGTNAPLNLRQGQFAEGNSMGIGSTLMKAVATQIGGQVSLSNWQEGAELLITIPRTKFSFSNAA